MRIAAREVGQLDQRQHLGDPRRDLGRRLPSDEAEVDVALDRHVGEERIGLKDHADRAAVGGKMGDVGAADADAPAVGVSNPAIMRKTVVLPQPEGPRKLISSPRSTARLKSLTTAGPPKDLRTPESERNDIGGL